MLCIGGAYFSIRMSLCAQRHILCDVVGAYDTLEILTLPDTHLVCLLDYECIGIAETRIRVYIVAYLFSAMPQDWQSGVLSHYQVNILRSESGFGDLVKMCSQHKGCNCFQSKTQFEMCIRAYLKLCTQAPGPGS